MVAEDGIADDVERRGHRPVQPEPPARGQRTAHLRSREEGQGDRDDEGDGARESSPPSLWSRVEPAVEGALIQGLLQPPIGDCAPCGCPPAGLGGHDRFSRTISAVREDQPDALQCELEPAHLVDENGGGDEHRGGTEPTPPVRIGEGATPPATGSSQLRVQGARR